VDEAGLEDGELTGLDFPQTGYYFARVCHASDSPFEPGAYYLIIYVPAGFQGVNVYAWDVVNNVPIQGATISLSGFTAGTTGSGGFARYPSAGKGSYTVSVTPPGGNQYIPIFGYRTANEGAGNPTSPYGNARQFGSDNFATVAYSGVALADTAYLNFGFYPVSYVTGNLSEPTYGLSVENAAIGFYRENDNLLFRGFPWAHYGTPWLTDASGYLPGQMLLIPNTHYRMEIHREGYEPIVTNITTPGKGQTLNLGAMQAALSYSGNAIPDLWEQAYGLPYNVNVHADSDLDGMTHFQEFIAGTIPTDGASRFVLPRPVEQANGDMTVRWTARPNRRYRVLHTPDLKQPVTWTPVYTPAAVAADQEMEYRHPAGDTKGYFQVDVQFP
jgi:hypothetical protein